jgi:DNA-directed RNA polymerase specialized sigma24 family protein
VRDVADGSFEDFVARRSTALLRTAYLLTGDRVRAEDQLQTALMAADRHWDRFADEEAATTFVRRQLVLAHTGRRRLLRVGDLLSGSPLLSGAAGLPGFAVRPADPGPQDELSHDLAGLPPQLRAALVLRYADGLSEAATAEALGRPVADVAADTARGLELLQTDGARLGRALSQRVRGVTAAPERVLASVREGAQAQRRHRLGLAVVTVLLVAIVLLVLVSL